MAPCLVAANSLRLIQRQMQFLFAHEEKGMKVLMSLAELAIIKSAFGATHSM